MEVHHQQLSPKRYQLFIAITFCAMALAVFAFPSVSSATDSVATTTESHFKPLKYSSWKKNVTYNSTIEDNSYGMQPLYNITHTIMWFFIGDDPLPDGYIVFKDKSLQYGPKVERNEWGDLLKHYWLILIVVVLTLLIVVSMPIIGLCFCCCRCAGACGGRSQPFDKQYDTCRRVFLGFLLIVLATGLLFGVIVAFVTNSLIQIGGDKGTTSLRASSNDVELFLHVSWEEMNHLLVTNYKEMSNHVEYMLKESPTFINDQLEQKSMAVSLRHLTDFLTQLPQIKQKLQKMRVLTNELRVYASQLSDGLRGVKRDLLVMLTKCSHKACQDVLTKYEIGKLDANGIHYDQLPDVSEMIDNIDKLITEDIASAVTNGTGTLESIRAHLTTKIAEHTPQIMERINYFGDLYKWGSNEIKMEFNNVSSIISKNTGKYADVSDKFMEYYSPYRFYTGLAVCSVLLLILVCLIFALLCGICGKRPSGYGDDCCNKGSGSSCLMFAVALIFLTISVITLVALAHFLVGIVAYRGICYPLQNPHDDEVFHVFEDSIDLNQWLYPTSDETVEPLRLSKVISACQANQPIFEVMHIRDRVRRIESLEPLRDLISNLSNSIAFNSKNIRILSPEDRARILKLGESSLREFNSGQFIDNLSDTITKYSLSEISEQLRQTAGNITTADMKDVQVSLRNQALHLETYEQNLVKPMKTQSAELIKLAHELDLAMRYKGRSFEDSIILFVDEIERAQTFMNKEAPAFVMATVESMAHFIKNEIEQYFGMVVDGFYKNIGKCAPLARAYDAGIISSCNRIVEPLNGFWAGVIWCILLFLPTLIVAIKLSSLYKKTDPYPGPLVESEYLYDAYSERDHIPMANGPNNKRRKNKDHRRHDYYEDSVGSTSHGIPPNASGVRDTRYNDMAPKHWDGGPPRYQNPPMAPPASEYERPPPYYYPGATEQD